MNIFRYLPTIGPRKMAGLSSPVSMAHRHHFQVVAIGGDDLAVRGGRGRLTHRKPQHARDARAEYVRIHEPDPAPDLLEREREIHADRGLAYAALAAAHRDDVADPR